MKKVLFSLIGVLVVGGGLWAWLVVAGVMGAAVVGVQRIVAERNWWLDLEDVDGFLSIPDSRDK